jgi:hypothetical protein
MIYYARTNGPAHPHGPPLDAEKLPGACWWHGEYCFWSAFPHQPYEIAELDGRDDEADGLLAAYNLEVALAGFGRAVGILPPLAYSDFCNAGEIDLYAWDCVLEGAVRWPPRDGCYEPGF